MSLLLLTSCRKEDQFGRDVKLGNGNVASRILAIKIHNLDAEDKATIENEIGGVLRAIEFIYNELGVNRPLKSTDNKIDNQNKTDYRNQVNKVANAIKEIITALKQPIKISKDAPSTDIRPSESKSTSSKKRIVFASIGLMILVAVIYGVFLFIKSKEESKAIDKSIALLPFVRRAA